MRIEDQEAYHRVNPNFQFRGKWWSKKRYLWMTSVKGDHLLRIEDQTFVTDFESEHNTWDPVDWSALQDEYLYWKRRFTNDPRLYSH